MRDSNDLSAQELAFIIAYTQPGSETFGNGTQSAIAAGYTPSGAERQAIRMTGNVRIKTELDKRLNQMVKEANIDGVGVLRLIADQATADPRELSEHFVDSCRYCWGEGNEYQRTFIEMRNDRDKFERKLNKLLNSKDEKDHELARDMGEFDEKGGIGYDPRKPINPDCMLCFGRGEPKTVFKDTRKLSKQALALYAGVKQTKDGMQILTHSQDTARAHLAKHFGLLVERVDVTTNVKEMTPDQKQAEIEAILAAIEANKSK